MLELIQWLGLGSLGGLAVGLGVLVLAPQLLPAIAVRVLTGVLDGLSEGVRWAGGKFNTGGNVIFSSGAATFTLIVCCVVSAWAGDRYDFVRPYIPAWLQSEQAPVTEYKRKEAAKASKQKAQSQPAPANRKASKSAFDDLMCNITSSCVR
jgi:hypothetical protein